MHKYLSIGAWFKMMMTLVLKCKALKFKVTSELLKYSFKINSSVLAAGCRQQYLLLIKDTDNIDWRLTEGQNCCRFAKVDRVKHFGEDSRGKACFLTGRISLYDLRDAIYGWPYWIFYEFGLKRQEVTSIWRKSCLLLWTSFCDLHL